VFREYCEGIEEILSALRMQESCFEKRDPLKRMLLDGQELSELAIVPIFVS